MNAKLWAAMLVLGAAFTATPASSELRHEDGGDIIPGDKCHGIAIVDYRVQIVWPIPDGDSGRADDPRGDKGHFILLDYSLIDSYWRYAASGYTSGECVGEMTEQVCDELPPEARELLDPLCSLDPPPLPAETGFE